MDSQIYRELFNHWMELNKVEIGTRVKIIRPFKSGGVGCKEHTIGYVGSMDLHLGKEGTVIDIGGRTRCRVLVQVKDIIWAWDYRSLEIIEETFSVGEIFTCTDDSVFNGIRYMLGYKDNGVCLHNLEPSGYWSNPIKVVNAFKITREEFDKMSAGAVFTKIKI